MGLLYYPFSTILSCWAGIGPTHFAEQYIFTVMSQWSHSARAVWAHHCDFTVTSQNQGYLITPLWCHSMWAVWAEHCDVTGPHSMGLITVISQWPNNMGVVWVHNCNVIAISRWGFNLMSQWIHSMRTLWPHQCDVTITFICLYYQNIQCFIVAMPFNMIKILYVIPYKLSCDFYKITILYIHVHIFYHFYDK